MAFDPTLPADHSEVTSPELRAQFNGLRDLIETIPVGPQGPPGEVTAADLAAALLADHASDAANPTGVSPLGLAISDPPTQAEVQALAGKLDALITALRREP